jgi:phenylalanyl-tRNA synthetase beta chain
VRVALGWLAEWIPLPDSREALMERLTVGGLEIESVERTGPALEGVVVGQVVACERHPDADRLSVCRVDAGGDEPVEVVCGAPNVARDQKIAFAPAGTVLPDGTKLKKTKIRGVVSRGMICSARELALGDDHEGILVLDATAPVGVPAREVLGGGDTVLEIEITPNRGDWASLLGIAREVRSHFGGELTPPDTHPAEAGDEAASAVAVEIEAADGCPRYVARVVRGVAVGPSPEWLRERLEAAGVRAINNVVDVTNLVMLEFGQPLHAFDLATLRGGRVRVRRATPGEKLVTLDGETRALEASDLVIGDAERGIALAGVMGGAETEVSEATTEVLIESAQFHPTDVRRTARRLGLHSESSYRFERGVDPEGVARAADRAARLLAELAGGSVAPGRVEARGTALPHTDRVSLDPARVNRLLGTDLSADEVAALLHRADFDTEAPDPEAEGAPLVARVPSWRHDVEGPADLVEEVARIHGYDRVPTTLPVAPLTPVSEPPGRALAERVRDGLAAQGLLECITLPFAPADDPERLGLAADDPRRRSVRLRNPIQEEHPELRTSLLPSLLRAAQHNLARQVEDLRLFEVGPCFLARGGGAGEEGLPAEPMAVAGLITRGERPGLWEPRERIPLFFLGKGVAERVLFDLGYAAWCRSESSSRGEGAEPYHHPGAAARFGVGERVIGSVGELHPEAAARFGIEVPCVVFELALDELLEAPRRETEFREISRQPAARRDLAVLIDRAAPAGEVREAILATGGAELVSAELFDRYEGRGVPEGKVSLAFRLVFQRTDRAVRDAEIAKRVDRVVKMLAHRFGAQLRDAASQGSEQG